MRSVVPRAAALAAVLFGAPSAWACLTCPEHAFVADPPAGNQVFIRPSPLLAQSVTVHVINFDYSVNPQGQPIVDPTIFAGDTIHWQWDTGIVHDVKSVLGSADSFDSGALNFGQTFDHTFNMPGVYRYYCSFHGGDNGNGTTSGMAGTVTVLPVPEPASIAAAAMLIAGATLRRRHRV